MEKNKKIFYIIILVFMICLAVVGFKQSENKKVNTNTNTDTNTNTNINTNTDTNTNTNTNNEEQVVNEKQIEAEITTITFDENTNLEEARGMIYEKYSNNNLRIVGAIIQEVNNDHIIVKIYRAGEGTSSIVEEKKINITNNIPVFETVMSPENLDDEPVTTKKTIDSLKKGDHVVIECAEDKSAKNANEFTALIITKDVLVFNELLEDEEIE